MRRIANVLKGFGLFRPGAVRLWSASAAGPTTRALPWTKDGIKRIWAVSDEILTLEEAARYLKIGPTTMYQLARQGVLPGRKVGREWRFVKSELRQWLATPAPQPNKPPV